REPELPRTERGPKPNGTAEGRYVHIELPRVGTLSLTEVEVYSGGKNIAPLGKASQINVDWGGDADVAIDGDTDGAHRVTHTAENIVRPWWEVDLGATHYLDKIVVFNRTNCCQERLEGFTLSVLDEKRHTVAEKTQIPAPQTAVAFRVTIDADGKAQ